jgi:molybdate transport system permease protein
MALPCLDSQENIIDWQALSLSLQLAAVTLALLLPPGMLLARWLAYTEFKGKYLIEALVVLPLVLPPTVLGYYLLVSLGGASAAGQWLSQHVGVSLAFHFSGLVLASVIFNIPFLVQPIQRAFEAIPANLGEAAAVSGLNAWRIFWRVELPLAWPGVLAAGIYIFTIGFSAFDVPAIIGWSNRIFTFSTYLVLQLSPTECPGDNLQSPWEKQIFPRLLKTV